MGCVVLWVRWARWARWAPELVALTALIVLIGSIAFWTFFSLHLHGSSTEAPPRAPPLLSRPLCALRDPCRLSLPAFSLAFTTAARPPRCGRPWCHSYAPRGGFGYFPFVLTLWQLCAKVSTEYASVIRCVLKDSGMTPDKRCIGCTIQAGP